MARKKKTRCKRRHSRRKGKRGGRRKFSAADRARRRAKTRATFKKIIKFVKKAKVLQKGINLAKKTSFGSKYGSQLDTLGRLGAKQGFGRSIHYSGRVGRGRRIRT